MKKIFLIFLMTLMSSNILANDRYPVAVEFNTVFSCMKSRVGGLKNLNNQMMFNKVLEQCSCYVDLLEKKYPLNKFMDLDSEIQKNPNGRIAKNFMHYVKNIAIKECF